MLSTIYRWLNNKTYQNLIYNKNKIERYKGHLSAKETQLNDILTKLISSVKGFRNSEKIINKSSIKNVGGFLNNIKQLYPKVYSSKHFSNYEYQIVKFEKEVTHERILVNRFISEYNIGIDRSPILAKQWGFKKEDIILWNEGRNVKQVSKEYNKLNSKLKF